MGFGNVKGNGSAQLNRNAPKTWSNNKTGG